MREAPMRKWFASVAGLACLLGLIGGTAVADARPSIITAPEAFTVVGTTAKTYFHDVVSKLRLSPGDLIQNVDQLTDENNARVGKARFQNTVQIGGWQFGISLFDIKGRGEIVSVGAWPPYEGPDTPPFDVPVIGGTGDFFNVGGTVHFEILDAGARFTFDLIL